MPLMAKAPVAGPTDMVPVVSPTGILLRTLAPATQSPLAQAFQNALKRVGVDEDAIEEASLDDLRLLMRIYGTNSGA